MLVPKAPVDKDDGTKARKNDVGTAGQIGAAQPKPVPGAMKRGSDKPLRPGIASTYSRHHLAAG
jgi:hypothetical protein